MTYLSLRLGIFVALLTILLLTGLDPLPSTLIAAVLALALSLLFLNRQRDRLSSLIYEQVQHRAKHGQIDGESDLENELLDSAEVDERQTPTE